MSMPVETIISNDETLANSGFYWRERDDVKLLAAKQLEDAGFLNGFSTRGGGVSEFPKDSLNLAGFNEDQRANIYENRRRFLRLFDGDFRLALAWQVHGDNIRVVESIEDAGDSDEYADALISNIPRVLLAAKTADCVPVLIGDPVTGSFAAVHAGWRGTAQSIVIKAINKLSEVYGTDPHNLICAIGPAASKCSYEVGQDVIDQFAAAFQRSEKYFEPTRDGHALVDLHDANRDQLIDSGVMEEKISTAPFCTMERPDLFFSYRLEKSKFGKTGRLLSVIGRAS
ncbi:MAG: peptidoglycan editing factor PgeF [Acidobacteria bacterium]|nr:peptidoglycan editing factor PgeF [Acidobacteriota bacterium]